MMKESENSGFVTLNLPDQVEANKSDGLNFLPSNYEFDTKDGTQSQMNDAKVIDFGITG